MAGKQQPPVIQYFRRVDPDTGVDTHYQVGDTYDGPIDEDYYLSSSGPDGKGPLLGEPRSSPSAPAEKSASSSSSDSPSKEK